MFIAAILVASAAFFLVLPQPESRRRMRGAQGAEPFFVETVETLSNPGAETVESQRASLARNAAGASRAELRQLVGLRMHEVKIKTPDRISIVEYPAVKLKRTVRMTPGDYATERTAKPDPAKSCAGSIAGGDPPALAPSSIAEEVIGGLQTYKLAFNRTGLTSWRAPALACVEVRRRQFYADNQSTSNLDLVSYRFGEPPPTLFQPNPESTEATPFEMLNAWVAFKGLDKDPAWSHQLAMTQKFFQRSEDYYHAHRP
ncbi:MAG: hypothetical protein K2X03_18235 [Bryobacteraceae bacterium]|nr:hypothetical protein [Bryobacteraceae bacterium]